MLRKLKEVMDEILPCFVEYGESSLLLSKLQFSGTLTQDECDIVKASVTTTGRYVAIFELLKNKPDETLKRLQEICIEQNWSDLLKSIQSEIIENNLSEILLSDQEICTLQTRIKILNERQGGVFNSYEDVEFDVKHLSTLFTGREQELIELHKIIHQSANKSEIDRKTVMDAQKCTIITGLGGTGKTQLVLRYAQLYSSEYSNNILWINAESDSSITSSFQRLASEKLNLKLKTVEGKEKSISSVVFEVYKFFSNTKALFIFDNADGPFSEHFFPTGDNKPFILITSRMQQWSQIEVFKLNTFTESDAIQFVKKGLKITNETQEDNIKNLVMLFQNFPLALQQAVAFIAETNGDLQCVGSDYNIANYLIDYKVKAKSQSLLDHKINSYMRSQSSATTYTTWKVTIDKIKKNKNHGELSTKIFNLISCFASNKINPKIFLPLTEGNECKLASAVKLLIKYSMVNQNDGLLNVHPLVQEITLSDLSTVKNRMEQCLEDAQNILMEYFKLIDNFSERQQFVLPHIESLLSKIKAWNEYNSLKQNKTEQESFLSKIKHWFKYNTEGKKISERENVFNLLQCLVDGYFFFDCRKTISLLEELLKRKEEHFGPDHYQVGSTLHELGLAHGALGDPKMKKDFLERALTIQETHYGPEHYQLANTLHNLGCAHGDLGDPKMKKDFLERALAIKENHYGHDHYEVASTLHVLGNAHGDLGDPIMQKDLLERALAIKEKHYGRDHYQIASTLHVLGCVHGDLGDPNMQKDFLERALAIQEKHYGPQHYQLANTLHNLGCAHGDLGDPKMKKDFLERALSIKEKHYGPDHYEVASTLHVLGCAHGDLGDRNMQKDFLERALAIQEKHYGPEHYQLANTLHNLGCAHGDLGDPKMKKDFLEWALSIKEKHYGPDHYQVAITLNELGLAYGALGDKKAQNAHIQRAIPLIESHYGQDHKYTAIVRNNLNLS